MKPRIVRTRVFSIVSVLCLVVAPFLRAQTVQQPAAGTSETQPPPAVTSSGTGQNEEVIVLSPFVVDASADANGYKATSTLAGTRVRTDLKDLSSAISVVTQQFLQDTGAKNNADLLVYTPSTEVAGIRGNFSGVAGTGIYQENTISQTTRVRGLDQADNTRDYFLTDIPWDGFNVGRVDLQRGPNSILFGIGSPAGIINTSVNDANYKTAYSFENRIGEYGSVRNQLSLNQELLPGVLAIRVAAVKDHELFEQTPAYNNSNRLYGAIRFDPKLFSPDSRTTVRVKYEQGNIDSNNPRQIPPDDAISLWFNSGVDSQGHYGYNKIVINQYNNANPTPWGTRATGYSSTMAGGKGGNLWNALAIWNQTRSYWPDIINYYEDTPPYLNTVTNPNGLPSVGAPKVMSGASIMAIAAQPQIAKGIKDTSGNTLAGVFPSFLPGALPSTQGYMQSVGSYNLSSIPGGQALIPGGVYYANTVLQDPSVFNFYRNLLDGPNKNEWQKWNAVNATLEQSFFNDRLAFQLAFDHQNYTGGALNWMSGQNYQINVDINVTYADGSPNPNVGRPYAGNAASAPSLNYENTIVRDTVRFMPTYELRTEDFLGKSTLAKILGKHVFTGIWEETKVKNDYHTWAEYAADTNWPFANEMNGGPTNAVALTGQLGSDRSFEWIAYLGPSLLNKSSAAGANLQRINYTIQPPQNQTVRHFDATWKMIDPGWNALPASFVKQSNGNYTDGTTTVPASSIITLNDGSHLASWAPAIAATSTTAAVATHPYYTNPLTPPAGFVDPVAPYTFNSFTDGTLQTVQQKDNPANYNGWQQQNVTWMNWKNPTDYPSLVESANRSRFRDISTGFTWQGYLLDGDLVPTFGWRKDVISNFQTNAQTEPNTGFTSLNYPDDIKSRTDVRGESKTWGAVYHLPKFLTSKLPWDTTISVFADRSQNFKADASRLSMAGTPIPNANGKTTEYGVTITTLQDKLSLKVDWFKTKVANATLADTEGNSIGGMGGNAYFIADGCIWGWAWATNVQEGLRGNTPNSNFYDSAANDGLPHDTAANIAAYNAYNSNGGSYTSSNGTVHTYIGGNAIVNAWLNAPFPSTFFASYNLSPALDSTIAKRTGNLRDAYIGGVDVSGGAPAGGGSNFGNHQTTVDNMSNGYEVELNYQPVKNWNILVNYSHVHATHDHVDAVSQAFMGALTKFMNGPGGQVREWYNGGGPLGAQWNSSLVAPYTVELNEQGHAAPEVSPWRLNLVTTYTFDHGPVKGVFIGGALREEAGRIIGYKYSSTFHNINSGDPNYATNLLLGMNSLTLGGLDVNQTFIGPTEHHVDAWVGYSKKVTRDINWRIQLNIRSVGEKDRLMSSRINPDGSIALARIVQGMGWQLTNAFDF